MSTRTRIGFIQGRLSPMVDGKIQAFPAAHWREEFQAAESLSIPLMEWTLDQDGLHQNPYCTEEGRKAVRALMDRHHLSIPSVTGDCFMQAPFWKADAATRKGLLDDLAVVIESSASLGVTYVVVPLVDNGSIDTSEEADNLRDGLADFEKLLAQGDVRVVFESDYAPERLAAFMQSFPAPLFGVNYDIGNSAALGFSHEAEMAAYGERILNVHVKDRVLGGSTVELGTGAADLPGCVRALEKSGYKGNYILQTARAQDDSHAETLGRYADMTERWIRGD